MSGQPVADGVGEIAESTLVSEMDIRFSYSLLDNLHNQVRIADEKIRGIFSGSALLAAALAVNASQNFDSFSIDGLTPVELLTIGLRGLLLLTVAFSLLSAIQALLPQIVPRGARRSLFFFGHIAATGHEEFIAEFSRLGRQDSHEQILSQVHVNAQIVQRKYIWTRRAANAFMVAILVWIVVQVIEFAL